MARAQRASLVWINGQDEPEEMLGAQEQEIEATRAPLDTVRLYPQPKAPAGRTVGTAKWTLLRVAAAAITAVHELSIWRSSFDDAARG